IHRKVLIRKQKLKRSPQNQEQVENGQKNIQNPTKNQNGLEIRNLQEENPRTVAKFSKKAKRRKVSALLKRKMQENVSEEEVSLGNLKKIGKLKKKPRLLTTEEPLEPSTSLQSNARDPQQKRSSQEGVRIKKFLIKNHKKSSLPKDGDQDVLVVDEDGNCMENGEDVTKRLKKVKKKLFAKPKQL
uniref:TM237 protein n=1 Tax=Bursaphelenchus xylophilus TaxID=6326 RepID=A0A1I7SHE3_BURXY